MLDLSTRPSAAFWRVLHLRLFFLLDFWIILLNFCLRFRDIIGNRRHRREELLRRHRNGRAEVTAHAELCWGRLQTKDRSITALVTVVETLENRGPQCRGPGKAEHLRDSETASQACGDPCQVRPMDSLLKQYLPQGVRKVVSSLLSGCRLKFAEDFGTSKFSHGLFHRGHENTNSLKALVACGDETSLRWLTKWTGRKLLEVVERKCRDISAGVNFEVDEVPAQLHFGPPLIIWRLGRNRADDIILAVRERFRVRLFLVLEGSFLTAHSLEDLFERKLLVTAEIGSQFAILHSMTQFVTELFVLQYAVVAFVDEGEHCPDKLFVGFTVPLTSVKEVGTLCDDVSPGVEVIIQAITAMGTEPA
ncbi:hypothetical protein B566_EDAN016429 [Ephemera danica]|nr:hypothetical protein B566_EDAN016429 [Ephemera danica]